MLDLVSVAFPPLKQTELFDLCQKIHGSSAVQILKDGVVYYLLLTFAPTKAQIFAESVTMAESVTDMIHAYWYLDHSEFKVCKLRARSSHY